MAINRPSQILIRHADADDRLALTRLAALDSADTPPRAPLLVAELDGELKVAISLRDGSVIADPFTYTAEVVSLLKAHGAAAGRRAPLRARAASPGRRTRLSRAPSRPRARARRSSAP